jgi:hypothetical protein
MKKFLPLILCITLLLLFVDSDVIAQCAMCKKNVETDLASGGTIGKAINSGILYLMAIPYILIGTVGAIFFRKQIAEKWAAFRKR